MTLLVFFLGFAMLASFGAAFYQFDYKKNHELGRVFVKIGSILFVLFLLAMFGSVIGIFIRGESTGYEWGI